MSHREEAEAWISGHVEPVAGMVLVHEQPWASVWQVPVAGGAAWFKMRAPVQAFEPGLTATLAARWPERLPCVLGCEEERGWLLLGDAGQPLGFGGGREPWLSVLPRYAELQQGEAVRARDHVDRGVPDRRIATFPSVYDATLARPLPLSERDFELLQRFRPRFGELCEELAAGGLPETIQHDDLHGGNVYLQEGTARILDWGDSCISHPFLTLFVTFAHSEEADGGPNHGAWFAPLRDAYLEIWGEAVDLRASAEIALRLGAFAHLFKELRVFDAVPQEKRSKFAPDLRAILARCVAATVENPRSLH